MDPMQEEYLFNLIRIARKCLFEAAVVVCYWLVGERKGMKYVKWRLWRRAEGFARSRNVKVSMGARYENVLSPVSVVCGGVAMMQYVIAKGFVTLDASHS